ncbi:hypothetical protein SAMN06269301_2916 [Geobacter sp. DSM 9736]|nr:hypothetical protein SAMN06269301_2916 [Geobacter sp. DSM 9736]
MNPAVGRFSTPLTKTKKEKAGYPAFSFSPIIEL